MSAAFWIGLSLAGTNSLRAQVDVPGPERLTHVEGYVVNPVGRPVADLDVILKSNDKVVYQTKTGKSGEFQLKPFKGEYTFHVARSEYAAADREIVVTDEIVTALARKKLYVILGPGACADACSAVLTSKKDFDRAIRKNNRHKQ